MNTYDIHDDYELHNLLKKLYRDTGDEYINFGRMPTIKFGKANRDDQVMGLLLQYAPVMINDLADAYESEYGVHSISVRNTYLKNFDKYFYKGMYTVEVKQLSTENLNCMNAALPNDFYTIADIKRIYLREIPDSDASNINPSTIKALGFKMFSNYVIRNIYISAAEYFRKVLTSTDIVDMQEIPKEIIKTTSFIAEMTKFKSQLEIVEFSDSKCINIRKLEDLGITRDNLRDYYNTIYSTVETGNYFTIKLLRKNGFSHLIDNLGFEEWFYSSILSQDNNRFSYRHIGKNRVFIKGKHEVLLNDFIASIVNERSGINIYDLIKLMEDDYGVTLDKQKIRQLLNSSSMYYNPIMQTVYIDYYTYFRSL